VLRLEEFDRSAVETVAGQPVLQYRGEILPLIHVGRALRSRGSVPRRPRRAPRRAEPLQVVVCSSRGRQVGLIVGRILDIVDEVLTSRSDPIRSGVLFNAVVQDRVTEFLDVEALFDGERNRTSMGN
jgi:two-component system chemotaxis sensor kinase CheA